MFKISNHTLQSETKDAEVRRMRQAFPTVSNLMVGTLPGKDSAWNGSRTNQKHGT